MLYLQTAHGASGRWMALVFAWSCGPSLGGMSKLGANCGMTCRVNFGRSYGDCIAIRTESEIFGRRSEIPVFYDNVSDGAVGYHHNAFHYGDR